MASKIIAQSIICLLCHWFLRIMSNFGKVSIMIYKDRETRNTSDRKISIWHVFRTIMVFAVITVVISVQVYRIGSVFRYWYNNKEEKKIRIQEIAELEKQQEEMNKELDNLKYNVRTNERLARSMGYVKSGEIVYKFKPKSF